VQRKVIVIVIISLTTALGLFLFLKNFTINSSGAVNSTGIETNANAKTLKIYTYSSFATTWGPGPLLKEAFEKECHCTLTWLTANDSRTIIQKLELQKNSEPADLILGLDFFDTTIASEKLKLRASSIPKFNSINWNETILKNGMRDPWVPFDWGLLSFNVHGDDPLFSQVTKLDDLLDPKFKKALALQDPRTRSPGLLFLFWIFTLKGEENAKIFLKELAPNVHTYGSSWSTSYGLFTEGQAKSVFSYTTSPIYHLLEEKKTNFKALALEEPLPMHIEYAGILDSCLQCELADQFLLFLLRPEAQRILMQKNFMYPVITGVDENSPFANSKDFKSILVKGDSNWIEIWKSIQRAEN
jgi:thiamine transport system substrate-binding protein